MNSKDVCYDPKGQNMLTSNVSFFSKKNTEDPQSKLGKRKTQDHEIITDDAKQAKLFSSRRVALVPLIIA
jgi:hypothetical protein